MLTSLRNIIQEVSSAEDFKEALNIMVKRIANALDTQACSVFLLNRHQGEYVLVATQGLNPAAVGKVRIGLNKGLIGLVGEREEPSISMMLASTPVFCLSLKSKKRHTALFWGHQSSIIGKY